MAIPFKPVGIGAVAAMNVLRITFSEALSAIPLLQAWDSFAMNTVVNKIFTGTTGNGSKPMIAAIGCDEAPADSWWPADPVPGAAVNVASRLKGGDGYCELADAAPGAGGHVFFNFNFLFPEDVIPTDTLNFVLGLVYRYTGAAPSLTWAGNDGGSEGAPSWTTLTSQPKGTNGAATVLKPSDSGGSGTGDQMTIPPSGEEHPDEIWATAAA
jgi:hypothetical protein